MKNPLVSVVIPIYNRPEALERTLASVINQSYKNLEILVVDDGSDIKLCPIITKLQDSRISYKKLKHTNANIVRNYGIEHSKGEYIAMLDADDLWLENHVEECLKTLLENITDGVYGSLILRNTETNQERTRHVRALREEETMIDYLLSTGYGAQTSTLFMTAKSVKDILWNPALYRHQDYDFVVRYSKKYQFTPKFEPTTIYTYGEPKQLKIDFRSCIQVIKENENDISPHLYNSYHSNMLSLAKRQDSSIDIIEHYKRESTYYKEHISFYQFLITKAPKSKEEVEQYRTEYIEYIKALEIE